MSDNAFLELAFEVLSNPELSIEEDVISPEIPDEVFLMDLQ